MGIRVVNYILLASVIFSSAIFFYTISTINTPTQFQTNQSINLIANK